MLKKAVVFHVLPLAVALIIAIIFISLREDNRSKTVTIKGPQTAVRGKFGNLLAGDTAELNYMASLQNKNQLTIFGSSEFTNSPFCPYNFFPDSLGAQMLGIGHAYHQSLSILIELLAADQEIDSTNKMCFIISPSWFTTAGTNTAAFVEFARPNFLRRISNNKSMPPKYKAEVGRYIANNQHDLEGLTPSMEALINQYEILEKQGISKFLASWKNYSQTKLSPAFNFPSINYNPTLKNIPQKNWSGNFDSIAFHLQSQFLREITTNNLFVYDDYYTKYLSPGGEPYQQRTQPKIDASSNIEYQQFKTLCSYLKYKKVKASFIIIPLNPYCYVNLDVNTDFFNNIASNLEKSGFNCYNLYVNNKETYEPGTLMDVMHLGDFGWMLVNKFIFERYYESNP